MASALPIETTAARADAPRAMHAGPQMLRGVSVPVTVDFEAGYGLAPREIAQRLIAAGAAGMNLEDSDHHGDAPAVGAEQQAERLAAVRAACRAEGVDLVLNARVDMFVLQLGTPQEQLTEGIRRARLYREAGADCVYPITLANPEMITAFVDACGVINVNLRPGGPLSLAQAASLGVRRITYGGSLFREAMTALKTIAAQVKVEVPTQIG